MKYDVNVNVRVWMVILALGVVISATRASDWDTVVFTRVSEPRENAFSLLIPKGWTVEGGIFRVDPTQQGGAAQSIAAKLDLTVKKDAAGTVMIRWLPDMLYFDARNSPAGQMGLFPTGSNYNGMTVYPVMSAVEFIRQVAFNSSHQAVGNVTILRAQPSAQTARNYQFRIERILPGSGFSYDAGIITSTYSQNGVQYKEKFHAVIENWGQLGAGMWGNKETFFVRAPQNEYTNWEPVFSIMLNSVEINTSWLAGELRGQIQRGQIALDTQQEVQRIEREIATHRRQTNAEIHHDMFLTLMDQEDYINPYTGETETGSNQWKHRWVNESGEVIYTQKEDYDPNVDVHLNRSDYKRSPVRKR